MAVALTWGGAADTGIAFNEFFDDNFTIAVRFLRQYPNGYAGPFFCVGGADASGVFFAGQGDYGDSKLPPTGSGPSADAKGNGQSANCDR